MLRFTSKLYYSFKPFIPKSVRVWLRRVRAERRRHQYQNVWPIHPGAGMPPKNWRGWPEGKQFAVVLTHDVEGSAGVPKIERILDLEALFAFRSSFNLVPADTSVTAEVRAAISIAGGEVGVHGWKHDGKLFFSRKRYLRQAAAIRFAMAKWGAVGFRAPFMHRHLGWLNELGVEYDSSTFDTDPFEPEPDGVQTIYPYWVGGGRHNGYVELPYTLVQDCTLFNVLGEKTIELWKRKVDWIAARGGMVLVNTHPDYMSFGAVAGSGEYPVSHYRELLEYLQRKYGGRFWHALPRDVAKYYKETIPLSERNSRKRICMVTYSNYETDNRVRRYAEALTSRGDLVDVIAIETGDAPLGERTVAKGVQLFTLQRRIHNEGSHWTYAYRLLRFLLLSSLFLRKRHIECRYDLIHVHNIPDFMVFSAWYPKMYGAGVVLDIHDIVPELFSNKFQTRLSDWYVRFLKKVEMVSSNFADHVIIANHLWFERITSRSVSRDRCTVFINNVDRALFYRRTRTRRDGPLTILFHGTFQWHQGIEVAIEALPLVHQYLPGVEIHLYGGGAGGMKTREKLAQLAHWKGVERSVRFFDSVPLQKIPEIVVNADVGIVPKRADSFGNEAYSTKIMEFMSQGVPVVVSRTRVDSYYFDEETVSFFESGNAEDMARAIIAVLANQDLREKLIQNGLQYVERHCWESVQSDYFALLDGIHCDGRR